jgi:CRP/FNR family transcriptional regulator, cyclic AMP receptor protein
LKPITIDLGIALGVLGVAFSFASFVMKRMLPLRAIALISNICFIGYGYIESLMPSILLNSLLLPVNAVRLWQITKLSKEISRATLDSPLSQWLLPHMYRSSFKAGEVLFRQGEVADKLIYITLGRLRLEEIGEVVGPGDLLGEIGLFSPEKTRTLTLVCETDGEYYYMTDQMIFQLYYQNPKLGFHLMRLVVERLLKDVRRHKAAEAMVGDGSN